MKKFFALLAVASVAVASNAFAVPFVNIVETPDSHFDVFYTPDAGTEFTAWDLIVTPTSGGLLDPNTGQRAFNTSAGNVPLDTFGNTVFSAVGAGQASHIFTAYNPGSAFPPVPAQTPPTVGGNPSQLFWTMFDTATGDGPIDGFTPYHMARVMFTAGGAGTIELRMFNTVGGDIADITFGQYGIPEPSTMVMGGLSLIGLAFRRRMA